MANILDPAEWLEKIIAEINTNKIALGFQELEEYIDMSITPDTYPAIKVDLFDNDSGAGDGTSPDNNILIVCLSKASEGSSKADTSATTKAARSEAVALARNIRKTLQRAAVQGLFPAEAYKTKFGLGMVGDSQRVYAAELKITAAFAT